MCWVPVPSATQYLYYDRAHTGGTEIVCHVLMRLEATTLATTSFRSLADGVKAWLKVTGRPEANYDIMKSSAGQNGTCQHYPGLNFANLTREYSLVALPCMADVFKNDMSCKSKQVELQGIREQATGRAPSLGSDGQTTC